MELHGRRLARSRHRIIGGVCGGIAEFLGVPRWLVRVVYVAVSLASVAFPGTIVYIILWIVLPAPQD